MTATRLRFLGTDLLRGHGAAAAPPPGHLPVDGVPGPGDVVQPHPADRRPARRGGPLPPGHEPLGRRAPAPSTGCAPSTSPAPERRARPVPARALGRPAPAGHDRHGPHGQPGADHRRRADDRPRRHHPAAGARSCCGRSARRTASPPAHQPRRRRGPRGLRPGAGDVRRPHRGGPARGRPRHAAPGTPTRGPSWRRSRTWTATSTGRWRSSRVGPSSPSDVPVGLRLRRPLSAGRPALPGRGPAARGRCRRSPGGLLARRTSRSTSSSDAAAPRSGRTRPGRHRARRWSP